MAAKEPTASPFEYVYDSGERFNRLYRRVSDGVIFRTNSREIKDARAAGKVEGLDPKPVADGTVKRPKVKRPRDPEAKEAFKTATKAVAAAEYGVILGAFFNTFAVATSQEHWKLAEVEQKTLGDAVAGVMPQLPATLTRRLSKASPWIKLALVTSQVVGPRIVITQSILAQRGKGMAPIVDPPTSQTDAPTNGHAASTLFVPVPEKGVNL